MTSLKDLIAQRAVLDKQIEEMRKAESCAAIEKIQALIAQYELTAKDVFPNSVVAKASKSSGSKGEPMYRDPVSQKTWTGKGKPPNWFDKNRQDQFLIAKQ